MAFLDAAAVVVRCRNCGVERDSFNDPRSSNSVIECKARCFASHRDWDFVRVAGSNAAAGAGAAGGDVNSSSDGKSKNKNNIVNNSGSGGCSGEAGGGQSPVGGDGITTEHHPRLVTSFSDSDTEVSPRGASNVGTNGQLATIANQPLFHIVRANGELDGADPATNHKNKKNGRKGGSPKVAAAKKDGGCCCVIV